MLGSFRNRRAGVLIWALMAALVLGLAGFGIGAGRTLTSTNVARVGSIAISDDQYVRGMQQELRALQQQTGRDLTMAEARQYGVDGMVLSRLVNDAALDGEAARLGVSTGDAAVRAQVVDTPAFKGTDGTFDRTTYVDTLGRVGLKPATFEDLVRRESTRNLIAGSVQAAVTLPDTEALTVLGFLGEKRGFDWLRLDASLLPAPIRAPTDAELAAYHDAHAADRYTRPETREISYASVTPESLAAEIQIPDDELRTAYDAQLEKFQTPERRAVDRIAFPTTEEAAAAKARLDKGEIDFDSLATERGLKPEDIDQGTIAADALAADARAAVFGASGPGIVGPVDTPLGPSLYRINAIMAAHTKTFDEAKVELGNARALEEAKKQIADDGPHIEDLIAGGATLEEIASETVLQLGSIALNSESSGGIAEDKAFRDAAAKAQGGEETDLVELTGGGLVTLRVDKIDPPAVIPLADIRDRVAADWTAEQTTNALTRLANGYVDELKGGLTFGALAQRLDQPIQTVAPLTRGETAPGLPPALIADVFSAPEGGTVTRSDATGVIIAQLTGIEPFDPAASANGQIVDSVQGQYRDQARSDLLALYTAALREKDGVTVNQSAIDSALSRFP